MKRTVVISMSVENDDGETSEVDLDVNVKIIPPFSESNGRSHVGALLVDFMEWLAEQQVGENVHFKEKQEDLKDLLHKREM